VTPAAGDWFRELRAPFLPASAAAVCVGAALAWHRAGVWHGGLFAACLAGVGCLHAGANVLNDYCDHRSGNDACNTAFIRPFTGGSRLIQQGRLRPAAVLGLGAGLLGAGFAIGLALALRRDPGLLLYLGAGLAAGIGYSLPRIGYAARGAGEGVIAAAFGLLPVTGTYRVLTGAVTREACLAALPVAVLIGAVLFVNQFPDAPADAATGKRHWVVRLGRRRASRVYAAAMATGPALLPLLAALRLVPGALAWAALPGLLGIPAVRRVLRHYDEPGRMAPANALTIAVHLATCAAMGLLLLAGRPG
jgi:1,4-dihydroxy-2-naphthoate octaprenyltransferase